MIKLLKSMYKTVNTFKRFIPNNALEPLGIKVLPLDLEPPSPNSNNYYKPLPKNGYNSKPFTSFYPFGDSDDKDEKDRSDNNDAVLVELSNLSNKMEMLF
ncbi:hypothetical protein ACJ73_04440 [Blastomyces percursus]|uniref:Uncharacterized protein n=1 Tax=Blastomyces percursus TaxID=1658174 RepID=A0A1J9Q6U6_9EURO|nr:hypothetical protein ACJ73_04440 [Blastomyces percursus]